MSQSRSKRYPAEFKRRALDLVESSDLSVAEVARQLDLSPKTLYNWRTAERTSPISGKSSSSQKDLEQENKRLRKELARLKEEQTILKKACAYFAKDIP
ncbi:putative transposase IS3/IS911 family protein [Magnetofaba australis IT-1]|uniref:Putative transposase IS3/IS911 family protein n=1 Tax=Magnetofaba australis IT-1 TaxID=1434232 RepID=A0A1Y2K4P7_9PROT|nr:putative transposase IS3/IS911 family protein [Magnetofaba australis IT-1]